MAPEDTRWHLQANLTPKYSVIATKHKITYQGTARLDLYFIEATGFSPFSFYGVTGQDNILTNTTINKLSAKDWLSVTHNKEYLQQILRSKWKQTVKGEV